MLGTQEQRTEWMKKQAHELIEQAYHRGYKAGYQVAKENIISDTESRVAELMEIGRNEAWEVADKLNRMHMDEVIKVFENDPLADALTRESIFSSCSPELAIEKLKAYEVQKNQEKDSEIHVGDEVYPLGESYHSVVTCVYYEKAVCITKNGKWEVNDIDNLQKTGRTFPEIAEVLKKLQEGKE